MSDQVIGVTIKGIGDFSDVVSNVGSVQKALTKLKLPDKLGDSLNKNISNFMKEYDKYQKKITEGIHTQGDQNAVNKSLNSMLNSYEKIIKDFGKLSEKDFKDIFNLDTGEFKKFQQQIKAIEADIKKIKLDPKALIEPINKIKELTSAKRLFGNGTGFDKLTEAFNTNDLLKAKEAIQEIDGYLARFGSKMKPEKLQEFQNAWNPLKTKILDADAGAEELYQDFSRVSQAIAELGGQGSRELQDMANGLRNTDEAAKSVVAELKQLHANEFDFNRQAADIDRQIQSYFGLSQMIRKVGDIAKDAFATVKELDKAMTQTAVVTNFNVGDMWDMLPTYTAQANQLGSTIKDVYEAATLYYQQGLNTNQAMSLANETLKMARIAGLDAADATNMMTAALRGFNMEINQMSAQKVNDIYSELAAITASDTKEIGSAMERTASIANSANMDFATTSAFLAQMIETTREAPENLGTAMKTIVARFQEMKQDPTKLIDSEGVAMDANKVDKALKTIGVNLMNTKGEFRDLDDVFLDIASKWDSLSQGQQRYIATIAAGSRQQSRFIAMMSDYERTMELVDAANNSAGASQRQFEKTLDSMEAKLNMLKNAWDQFTMGLMNNQILKFGVDALTEGFTVVNNLIDALSKLGKPFGLEGLNKSLLTLATTLGMLQLGKKGARGLVMGGAAWFKGEGGFFKNFSVGFRDGAAKAGTQDGQVYSANFTAALKKGKFKEAFNLVKQQSQSGIQYENTFQAAFGQFSAKELSAGWTSEIETEIRNAFLRATQNVNLTEYGIEDANEYLNGLITRLQSGETSAAEEINILKLKTGGQVDLSNVGVNKIPNKEIDELGNSLTRAGSSLQTFGIALQNTPLAPFGTLLSKVGMLASGFGSTIAKVATIFTNGMNMVVQSEVTGSLATAGLAGGFKALWAAMLESPLFPIIAALLALYGIYKALDAAIVSNKEQLEAATDAAAAASEAYDSAKQETSELADAIDTIRETDSAFDGLVAGTAEFNEQLVTANEQIMALIDKYPMLNDSQYLSTDKNGLMHINEAGFKAVKEYQKQIQARASAMNLIQTADLNALENQQKAQQLRNSIKTNMSDDEQERILRNADLLEQRAEAETKLAQLNAIRVGLVDKEIADQEKLASIYVDQYEAKRKVAETEVEAMNKHERRQAYADYHGYTYDKSTKKIKDIEGNEIDYNDAAIKDEVIEQTVMLDFEANASSLEGILHSLDRDFSKTLNGTFENSSTFISDILSNNAEANEDLLQQVLDNPKQLNDFVEDLSTKELAAVLGASESAVEANVSGYKQELENKLLNNAQNIIDTNAQANGELAAMLAQAQSKTANEVLTDKNIQNSLIEQIRKFTSEQRNTLLSIGKILEESAGSEAMATFVSGLSDIYKTNNEELITATQDWIDGVNWETATGRLKGYNEAINMTTENTEHLSEKSVQQINNLGQSLLNSRDEANLLGEAFEEFYNSTDFQEMAENMDKFVDSSGQLNAASIMDMAEECHSLNSLLDTGAISAGGVAAALNALGSSGDLVLSDLNSRVLELLSNFGQLDNIIASSHRNIENFDWGIDTGESADFVKESAEKWNELYKGGEVGNPQLEAYAKYVLGEEKYINLLASNSGNLQATMDDVSKYVNEYADGFDKAWDSLAKGNWQEKVPKELQDLGISFGYDENGKWEWNPGTATTEQLSEWLQAVKNIGPEMAAAMIEDWQNYSPNFRAERQKNDFEAGLDSYVEQRRGANGEVAITASELNTIVGATGQKQDEVIAAIAERAGIDAEQVEILQNINENTGEYVTDGAVLNRELTEAVGAKGQNGWLAGYQARDSNGNLMKNTIDIEDAMAGAVERGYTAAQAKSMAYESYTNAEQQGKDYYYKGELIEAGQYKTLDQFAARLEEIDQNEQWVTVGQAMADGFLNRMDTLNKPEESSSAQSKTEKPDTSNIPKGTTIPGVGYVTTDGKVSSRDLTWEDRVPVWVSNLISALRENKPEENTQKLAQEEAKASTQAFMDWFLGRTDSNTELNTTLVNASASIELAASNLTDSGTSLSKAASELSASAKELSPTVNQPNSPKQSGSTFTNGSVQSSTVQSNGNNNYNINTTDAEAKVTNLQTKLKTLNDLVGQGGTYTLNVSGVENIKAAATAAKTISKNSGAKTINVKTGEADTSSIKTAQNTISNTQAKIQVGANVDPATATVRRLQRTINGMSAKLDVSINQTGNKTVNIIVKKSGSTVGTATQQLAKGKNNHGVVASPIFGSVAKGRYGQLGPKGKGGLTLTGELGYEVAWLPDENRSMILGANGPQMINLPGNAVVWDHEQSKKIVKQKAIPAGSHSTSTRPGSTSGNDSGGSTSTSKVVTTAANKVTRAAETAAVKVGKVSVWWENIARTTEGVQRKADKAYSQFEKYVKSMQATLKTTGTIGQGDSYIANMSKVIGKNEAQYNKATKELQSLDAKGKTTVKWKQGNKNKSKKVNLGDYIDYDPESDSYEINQAKINAVAKSKKNGGKAKAKAIKEAAEQKINEKLSKRNKAEDEMRKAQEALDKFGEELYSTFFKWEVELTKIWNITKQIEATEKNISRAKTAQETIDKQLSTGQARYNDPNIAQQSMTAFNIGLSESINKIHAQMDLVDQQKKTLQDTLSLEKEKTTLTAVQNKLNSKTLNETERVGYEKYRDALQDQIKTETEAQKYFTVNQHGDGTVSINFDTEKFEAAKLEGQITEEQGKAIQDYVKKITDNSAELSETYQSANASVNELYDELAQLQNDWADYANELWDIHDKEVKERTDNLKKLSDSINKALKKLLEDVKRKLDERRQQEDNRKTELDISQKQQRLAMLRADTSGGHQVEIAQLQKEIAEAQQNYQRSLEDQLIDKLQQQADLAAEQRERQIELEEEIVEGINNAAMVDMWMNILSNPESTEEELRETEAAIEKAFKNANDYDKKPKALQDQLDNKFNNLMLGLKSNQQRQKAVIDAIGDIEDTIDVIKKSVVLMVANISNARGLGLTVKEAHDYLGASYKDLGDPNKGNYSIQDFANAGITYADAKQAFNIVDLGKHEAYRESARQDINTSIPKTEQELASLKAQNEDAGRRLASAQTQLREMENWLATATAEYNKAQAQLAKAKTSGTTAVAMYNGPGSLKDMVSRAQTAVNTAKTTVNNITQERIRLANAIAKKQEELNKLNSDKATLGFKTGGLADYTGPAWLDGTPSKPELVLNARDTQNFLALRDVLSKAIGSTNSITNSYGGDSIFEININVDKIEKDYDVDRVIEKVKKEITKGAGYRNVTQVRNFR